jgi:hypothetical protein
MLEAIAQKPNSSGEHPHVEESLSSTRPKSSLEAEQLFQQLSVSDVAGSNPDRTSIRYGTGGVCK